MLDRLLRRLQTRVTAPAAVADLLNGWDLLAFGRRLRLIEVETYLHRPDDADPFVHCDPRQTAFATWYLHRKGGTLKNGTFKGLDLTYGDPDARIFGGLLIRSLEAADGSIVCGPCNVVDHLIAIAGVDHVARLAELLQPGTPAMTLEPAPTRRTAKAYATRRIGLGGDPRDAAWKAVPERYLTEPRRVKKGRRELIDALLAEGRPIDDIRALTGSPRKTITARAALR